MEDSLLISVVIPIFNEEGSLEILYNKLTSTLEKYSSWEIIFVDDGSDDESLTIMQNIVEKDKRVKIITFYRNYGKSYFT